MGLRQTRLADEIRDIIAGHFNGGRLSDPRLDGVSITSVRLTGDLQVATVFYRTMSLEQTIDADLSAGVEAALESCSGLLRKSLSRALKIRRVPELRFRFDESIDTGARIEGLLDQIK